MRLNWLPKQFSTTDFLMVETTLIALLHPVYEHNRTHINNSIGLHTASNTNRIVWQCFWPLLAVPRLFSLFYISVSVPGHLYLVEEVSDGMAWCGA